MKKLTVYNSSGEAQGEVEISDKIFGVKPKVSVVHQIVVSERSNARNTVAHTKTRGEIRGGGKKPWRQKGTGRARVGSIRSPLWRKGGIVFGPRSNRNYSQKVSRSLFRTGMRMVLSDLVASGRLLVVSDFAVSSGKAKDFIQAIRNFMDKVKNSSANVAVVAEKVSPELRRSAANVPGSSVLTVDQATPAQLLRFPAVIITSSALQILQKRLE